MTAGSVQHVPGKVVLIGEHAVLRGHPAIAAPVPRYLTLSAALGAPGQLPDDPGLRRALTVSADLFGLNPHRIRIRMESRLPAGEGLGSSAALSVALVRTLADLCATDLDPAEAMRMAIEVENAFHRRSSGLDIHAVSHDGPIWFEPGPPRPRSSPIAVGASLDLVVAQSGQRRSTADQISRLTRPSAPGAPANRPVEQLGRLAHQARAALVDGDLPRLGRAMDCAHRQLADLGVSTPVLDRMVGIARAAGAVGAKLTGAGNGGSIIALAPRHAARVTTALHAAGFTAFVTRLPWTP